MNKSVGSLLVDMGMLDQIFLLHAKRPATVTSVRDGEHMPGSRHYEGRAFDLRANDLPGFTQINILNELKAELPEFDVILHGVGMNIHFHIELDPN